MLAVPAIYCEAYEYTVARLHSMLSKEMNIRQKITIIKNGKRKVPAIPPKVQPAFGANRWSTAVKSWVREFQQRRRRESLPAFDRLFK